jgi:hypothetical protein
MCLHCCVLISYLGSSRKARRFVAIRSNIEVKTQTVFQQNVLHTTSKISQNYPFVRTSIFLLKKNPIWRHSNLSDPLLDLLIASCANDDSVNGKLSINVVWTMIVVSSFSQTTNNQPNNQPTQQHVAKAKDVNSRAVALWKCLRLAVSSHEYVL